MRRFIVGLTGLGLSLVIGVPLLVAGLAGFREVVPDKNVKAGNDYRVAVSSQGGKIVEISLEKYVAGVVTQEMPASFEFAALCAQAIAARTYVYKRLLDSPKGVISADPAISQAWGHAEEGNKGWSSLSRWAYLRKIAKAVSVTKGVVIEYKGHPIDAVYHSTSGKTTASAEEVWGKHIPYLISVPCDYCRESPRYSQTLAISWKELREKLACVSEYPKFTMASAIQGQGKQPSINVISYTPSGRVALMKIDGWTLTGRVFRETLTLPSTHFSLSQNSDGVTISNVGYGHGVGMCQYGANGMAEKGYAYSDILRHYYPGTNLVSIE